ncbi:MAG: bifunctional [glutamate--ammonia ligase]-adenylyl-L-tyrosine phosphorylase/[glutamate--ammonia-ligase] adenylyltransferase [Magnetococcales bacterium]|nr:bifunctional [glutamate--ammonia ligase]-adenylyl-L-tyrosine phosphorylase/[glutamate--ammonia-ligase] adenylyltransferase [Magnetococcales bacterium]
MSAQPVDLLMNRFSLTREQVTSFQHALDQTASPKRGWNALERWLERHGEQEELLGLMQQALENERDQKRLAYALGNSPFLTHLVTRWPRFLDMNGHETTICFDNNSRITLLEEVMKLESLSEVETLLRETKQHVYFQIGVRDLTREATLEEVTRTLSNLADASLEAGYLWLNRDQIRQHGNPIITIDGEEQPARFVVLGMGKLGGQELNFSSDVDLIYLHNHDDGWTDGKRQISIKAFFTKLGRNLAKLLSQQTAEGHVFRVDLRLRPEGESGDISLSTRSAEIYYESWGQTWERAAMIKARPVAGDLELGEQFLDAIRPFVYRRYLDYASLDAIRRMKKKIDDKTQKNEDHTRNVKLGYGGIREIEFFVQGHQLIHGGRQQALRNRQTIPTLGILAELGYIDTDTTEKLSDDYRFLRTVEHRLQIVNEHQTHSLPEEESEITALSKRMGMQDSESFSHRFKEVTERVHDYYGEMFLTTDEENAMSQEMKIARQILESEAGSERRTTLLESAGFQDPGRADSHLTALEQGPRSGHMTENMRQRYERFSVILLKEILLAPDQDMAIKHGEAFALRVGKRTSWMALLIENPNVLAILVRLFGTSAYVSRFLNNHPELMDQLVTRGFLDHYHSRSELIKDLSALLEDTGNDVEAGMDAVREFKNAEVLRLAIRDLSGIADLEESMAGLSALADAVLTQELILANHEMEEKHGAPMFVESDGTRKKAPFAIIAMGKLGGEELNYASDLDIIFIHGSTGDEAWTDGKRSISNTQFFSRLGQKIITGITTLTRTGKLYELDMRLRPSGGSGPLVTSIDSFRKYQRTEAWTWEHQALTRARVVAGPLEFVTLLKQEIREIITLKRDVESLRKDVIEMRERMYSEKKPKEGTLDIKQSRGGIVDVEFLTQFLILSNAYSYPDITTRNVNTALYDCMRSGLISRDEHDILTSAYRFYRLVENRLRLLHDRSENRIDNDPLTRRRLQRLCDLPEETDVQALLTDYFEQVRPLFNRYLYL